MEVDRVYVDCVRLSLVLVSAGLSLVHCSFVSLRSTPNPLVNLDLLELEVKPVFGLVHAEIGGTKFVLFVFVDV